MNRMTVKEKKHFDELNSKFQEVCKKEKAKGCSCPKVCYNGEFIELFGKQIIKGLGEVPCEARCQWDLNRIMITEGKQHYKKSDKIIIDKICKNGECDE